MSGSDVRDDALRRLIDDETYVDSVGGDRDCQHIWHWVGGRSDPAVRSEPEQTCIHCGAVNLGDDSVAQTD